MRHLELTAYEPGEFVGTLSTEGKVAIFRVEPDGTLAPSDNRLILSGIDPEEGIEVLGLPTRAYNVLKRESVGTIGQLLAIYDLKGAEGFSEMRSLGDKNLTEILEHIQHLKGT